MGYGFGRLNDLAAKCHKNSADHGFWDGLDPFDVGVVLSKLCLIHSEVSEACEGIRHEVPDKAKGGLAEELADVIIRCFDLAEARGLNIEQAVVNKISVNEAREFMHGKTA